MFWTDRDRLSCLLNVSHNNNHRRSHTALLQHTPNHPACGYFPSYSLGAMAAAQLYEAAKSEMPSLEADLAQVCTRDSSVYRSVCKGSVDPDHPPFQQPPLSHTPPPPGQIPPPPGVARRQSPHPRLPPRVPRRPPRLRDGQAPGPHVLRAVPAGQVRGAVWIGGGREG